MKEETESKKVFFLTFGCQMVTVVRDDFEAVKEDKWLGMKGLGGKQWI